ncbi:cellulase [Tieghemostelium lacteum]|uniref:Cellulase n=1 Tax=Tieghemostelium lacteum TaxID=361077 RepID=A0A151ZK34_TIELA|nr:cellulase [Tieghemostelium lacteum]|eukprot:KYQ94174.1 cellulase [Tieghemostelium lacteum]
MNSKNKLLFLVLLILVCQSMADSIIVFWNSNSSPGTINLKTGDTITFYSTDGQSHTVESSDGTIDSGVFSGSASNPGKFVLKVTNTGTLDLQSKGETLSLSLTVSNAPSTSSSTGSTTSSTSSTATTSTGGSSTSGGSSTTSTTGGGGTSTTTSSPTTGSPLTSGSSSTTTTTTTTTTNPGTTGSSSEPSTTTGGSGTGSSQGGSSSEQSSSQGSESSGEQLTCKSILEQVQNDQWTYSGVTYTVYQVKFTNKGVYDIEDVQISTMTPENLFHVWEFSRENNILSFPTYRNVAPLKPGSFVYFGYITNGTVPLSFHPSLTCSEDPSSSQSGSSSEQSSSQGGSSSEQSSSQGGSSSEQSSSQGSSSQGGSSSEQSSSQGGSSSEQSSSQGSSSQGGSSEQPTEGCSATIEEHVVTKWKDSEVYPFSHIIATVRNTGTKPLKSISLNISPLTQIWNVEQSADGSYKLPSYQPTIEAGAGFSFGYIVPSHPENGSNSIVMSSVKELLIILTVVILSCYCINSQAIYATYTNGIFKQWNRLGMCAPSNGFLNYIMEYDEINQTLKVASFYDSYCQYPNQISIYELGVEYFNNTIFEVQSSEDIILPDNTFQITVSNNETNSCVGGDPFILYSSYQQPQCMNAYLLSESNVFEITQCLNSTHIQTTYFYDTQCTQPWTQGPFINSIVNSNYCTGTGTRAVVTCY